MMCPMEAGGNADLLLDYAAGKLKADIREQLEQHMKICAACGEFVGAQSSVWQALDSWEPAEVSLDFDRRLYERDRTAECPVVDTLDAARSLLGKHRSPPLGAGGGSRRSDGDGGIDVLSPGRRTAGALAHLRPGGSLATRTIAKRSGRDGDAARVQSPGTRYRRLQDVIAMKRIFQTGSVLLLAVGLACASDQTKEPAKPAAAKGGVPKQQPIPKGGARLVNPAAIAARLFRMSPEEREHALEKLPNEQAREKTP